MIAQIMLPPLNSGAGFHPKQNQRGFGNPAELPILTIAEYGRLPNQLRDSNPVGYVRANIVKKTIRMIIRTSQRGANLNVRRKEPIGADHLGELLRAVLGVEE